MLPETVAAKAAGQRVAVATLFEFQFKSQTVRFWDGLRKLVTADGREWIGSGAVISASGLQQSRDLSAPQATFTLSGADDDLMAFAAGSIEEVTGRPVGVFIQFLSDKFVPFDSPIAVWSGIMDTLSFSAGAGVQTITLTAESLFIGRVRSPYAYMTDADQQARWPGDTGMSQMPSLVNKQVTWLRG